MTYGTLFVPALSGPLYFIAAESSPLSIINLIINSQLTESIFLASAYFLPYRNYRFYSVLNTHRSVLVKHILYLFFLYWFDIAFIQVSRTIYSSVFCNRNDYDSNTVVGNNNNYHKKPKPSIIPREYWRKRVSTVAFALLSHMIRDVRYLDSDTWCGFYHAYNNSTWPVYLFTVPLTWSVV